ncbi:MAG TPA: AraC family transcriptional regulator [Puia sp.]|jgi:AraC-like DNA-binding protein
MKPHLLKIPKEAGHSFSVRYDVVSFFYNKWHYHPELELVYIIDASGRQFIGDSIHHFKNNDLILVGSNLPHLWHCDEKFLEKGSKLKVEAIIVHFLPDCFGPEFFKMPENKALLNLFQKAEMGIRIKDQSRDIVSGMMRRLVTAKNSERIILLLQILETIACSEQTKTICSEGLSFQYSQSEANRLNNIYQHILNNFSRELPLEEIAKIAHLTPNGFCRYFKSRIKKPFSKFLLEVRIGHACKLLAESEKTVAEICYESGFNNFSNFNRHFKTIAGRTPLNHRKYYQEIRGMRIKISEDI